MRRREFITLVGGAAAAWPLAARAQQERIRRIGVLQALDADDPIAKSSIAAFTHGLQESGWTEGRNLRIDQRWAAGNIARLMADAAELVRLGPDIIFAGGSPALTAAQQATRIIPIVFINVADPVGQGFTSFILSATSWLTEGSSATATTFRRTTDKRQAMSIAFSAAPILPIFQCRRRLSSS
jgi:putative tryptophan/tyrosine transport system substrate-binding protein